MALRRLQRELKEIADAPPCVTAGPTSTNDIFSWTGTIVGPSGTPYQGGVFFVQLQFPADYPFKPPKVTFSTKVLHPNVHPNGGICLDILGKAWSPALTTLKVMLSISSLLSEPNDSDPLNVEAGRLRQSDPAEYARRVREWTAKYAM